jgi:hypothetical protein
VSCEVGRCPEVSRLLKDTSSPLGHTTDHRPVAGLQAKLHHCGLLAVEIVAAMLHLTLQIQVDRTELLRRD